MVPRLFLAALISAVCIGLSALPTWNWVDTYGSTGLDAAEDMLVDSAGNVYICGSFKNTIVFDEFHSLIATGTTNMFLCKLDPSGNVEWAFQNVNSGAYTCVATALAIDNLDNVYLCGSFNGNMTLGGSTLNNSIGSSTNAFFGKVDPSGNVLWLQGGGGTSNDKATAVAIDPLGQPVFTGTMTGTANFGLTQLISQGENDVFLARLDTSGAWLDASRYGGINDDMVEGIAIDQTGNMILCGYFDTASVFGSFSLSGSRQSVFVCKLNQNSVAQWCVSGGGTDTDMAKAIALGLGQTIYITGAHSSNAIFGSTNLGSSGSTGIFTAALDDSGNWLWASSLGINSSSINQGSDLLISQDNDLIITGKFSGTLSGSGYNLVSNGSFPDIFVARYNPSGAFLWALSAGGTGTESGSSLARYAGGGYYVYGGLNSGAVFGGLNPTSGANDIFLAILLDSDYIAPLAPGQISIQKLAGSCRLSWAEVTQNTAGQTISGVFYKIYRASQPDFSDEVFLQQTALPFYEENLPAETHYFYRVRAARP